MHQLRLFFTALQFFTRLPIPRWVGFEPEWLHHASRYFPAVGIVVGAVTASVYALASLWLPPLVAVMLSTIAGIYLTGAFHEDGFADTCDGMGGGMTRERVLEIMTDSRIGAYGAIGIVLILGLKSATLAQLPPQAAIAALLLGHPLSRLAASALIWKLAYVKGEGKAKPLAQGMTHGEFLVAVLSTAVPVAVLLTLGWLNLQALLAALAAVVLVTLWLARKFVRRLGGYTGDCLGAVQQVAEVVCYLAVLAAAH
ncbi:adenosylcobinamide-GDP ribazoletransferase [Noviherbaspirillum saxi]|uniref:Adenosylcobinamide-GDP ribazoletransferase n=1 Tax=Noviherbaspirillum saxi TaxID=2320863 RepID=A0A3A3FQF7_9BURK|nr:adenosylcobinamide-GDP ribazoletransferase [Noviherbaspirillum saxi]RJF98093.1 adenosylcobinamide-GDP ribazoletransferase [Noviherbaspirillum saxi]